MPTYRPITLREQISAGFLAGDFVGSLDGMVRDYNVENGEKLWRSEQHGPVASTVC